MKKVVAAFATTGVIMAGTMTTTMDVSAAQYEVVKNDTLWGIANQYDTSVQQLVDTNGLGSTIIYPGQVIETGDKGTKSETVKSDNQGNEDKYTVVQGDTLSHIALKYGVTVNEIQEWNDLSSALIVVGQTLTIKGVDAGQVNQAAEPEVEEPAPEQTAEANEANESNNEVVEVKDEPKEEAAEAATNEEAAPAESEGQTISVKATAYTAECEGCSGVTATGINLKDNPNEKVIAVDPNVIPLGTKVHVEGYGNAVAGDVGGAIKGDRIDVHLPSKAEANQWGVQNVNVTILD